MSHGWLLLRWVFLGYFYWQKTLRAVFISTGECTFLYIRQPPSTTIQGCSPYISTNKILLHVHVAIECIVRTRKDVNNTYEIRWIMKNTTGEVNYLTPNNTTCQYTDAFKICTRRYNIHNQRYNPSFLGKYWCQVINTTADPDQHLMRSNVFTLLPPDKYSEPTCTVVQYKEKTTCANLTDQSKSSPLPFSTTTMDISRPHLTSELHIGKLLSITNVYI